MTHDEYHEHIQKHLADSLLNDSELNTFMQKHKDICTIMINLDIEPAKPILESLYCPVKRKEPRDPLAMLRSLILMTLLKIGSIKDWVKQTRSHTLWAVLAGFDPHDTPGIGTYYDFMKRIVDSPYTKPAPDTVKRSSFNAGLHLRNLKEKEEDPFNPHHSKSEKLAHELLKNAHSPRADDFLKTLEDIFIQCGLIPTLNENMLTINDMIVTGDGSILETNASSQGKTACSCRSEGIRKCDHPRLYSSPTAQFCYDHHHDTFVFGDRYYILAATENGHDFPLHITMPGGNESDFTLSLNTLDRFQKAAHENDLNIHISHFCGDGHHDSYGHYHYLEEKDIIPVIPLTHEGKKTFPQFKNTAVQFDRDGTPLCPGGKRMRHHTYNKNKHTHVYTCPVKRETHRDGKSLYVIHAQECPRKEICCPESSLAPLIYIKRETDPRYFPPLDRTSKKFKEIAKRRSATERLNSVIDSYDLDSRHRNADYGLIRLTVVNTVIHARIRYEEAVKKSSEDKLFQETMEKIGVSVPEPIEKVA